MSDGRRVIVQVRFGPLASRKAVIEPGGALRVGRTELADFRVPHDRQMSGLHFLIRWDGARCHLRDLGSAKGTWLGGRRVEDADVEKGAWIRAGDTIFGVYVERGAARPDPQELGAHKGHALAALEARLPLFAVLDAARDARVLELCRASVEEYQSLYDWPAADELEEVAPYLVRLPKGAGLLGRLVKEGWGESFGIYLTSARTFTELRRHLQRQLVTKREGERRRVYFRYYDPRVLRCFLATCDARRTADLFGTTIQELFVEGAQGELLQFGPGVQTIRKTSGGLAFHSSEEPEVPGQASAGSAHPSPKASM